MQIPCAQPQQSLWPIDLTRLLVSSFEIFSQAFNAANSNCCLFWWVSAFTLLFSRWNSCSILTWLGQSKGVFTPDANEANKSRYSRIVGRLNILSLLASFARKIRFIRRWNSLHNRREFASWEGLLPGISSLVAKFIPVFLKVRSSIVQLWVPTYNQD